MYVITGATGNTGKPIALALLAAGKKVRIISRSPEKAKELTDRGAELFIGGAEDRSVLQRAFAGATAVYAMIPPDWSQPDFTAYQCRIADTIVAALQGSSVKYVVSLSSVGAHLERGAGVVAGLRYLEKTLDALSGLNVLHLRPAYFMENTLGQIGLVKAMGVMGSPMQADRPMTMIATRDVADYAARRLLDLDFAGHGVQYLLGRREITLAEVASVFGKAVGKPDLKYVEIPYEQFAAALTGMGATVSLAEKMNEFIRSFNEGRILEDARLTQESTTPTTVEDFAKVFAHVYGMQG